MPERLPSKRRAPLGLRILERYGGGAVLTTYRSNFEQLKASDYIPDEVTIADAKTWVMWRLSLGTQLLLTPHGWLRQWYLTTQPPPVRFYFLIQWRARQK